MGHAGKRKAVEEMAGARPKMPAKGKFVYHGDGYITNKPGDGKDDQKGAWRVNIYSKEWKRQWGAANSKADQFQAACELIEKKMLERIEGASPQ